MPLRFPRLPDIRLLRSPLIEVVCQVRFPAILRIANEDPTMFQERVRHRFPRLEREEGFIFQLQFSGSGASQPPVAQPTSRLFRFQTEDGHTAITLSADFYALSTTRYTVWEDFARDLLMTHDAVREIYQPGFSTRIGLRYVDQLTPSKLGLGAFDDVVDLLRPELTALLRVDVWDLPRELLSQLVLDDQEGHLGLRFGKPLSDDEPTLILDFDYYDDRELPFEGLVERCHRYHDKIYDAFRWCLREDRLDVFQPVAKQGERE